jgi:hypothetical protein
VALHDRQIRITADGDDRYEHTIERVTAAQTGPDAIGILVVVDPRFQELVIHAVRLTHAGETGRTFTAAQMGEQVRSQSTEAEPGKREFNPRVQISVQVPGAQHGDILEYEYTVHSYSSRTQGMFAGHYAAQWASGGDQPVRWERLHVLWPAARALQFRLTGPTAGVPPQIQTHPGELDLQWHNLLPADSEPDIPRWFPRQRTVQLSDFASWTQVAALLAPEYGPADEPQDAGQARLEHPTALAAPGLILDALRLVRSKVRAIQVTGDGIHAPADPAIVLQRGYGDGRDITRLLVSVLRGVGIDAQAALADGRGALLDTRLPSPYILNSALVMARAGTTEYWLNPMAPGPAEVLQTTDPADLHRALLIAATGGTVVALPPPAPDSALRLVRQQFDLRNGASQPAVLILTTRFQGSWAQAVRADLFAQSPAQLQLTQIQTVAQDYPSATAEGEVHLQNLPDQQAVQLTARFRLPQPLGDSQDPQFSFFAEALAPAVQPRDEATRHFPLSLPWPMQLEEQIEAALPPDFAVSTGRMVIENPAFRYQREIHLEHGTLHIDHRYVALSDHVDPGDYPKFLQANAQVYAALGLRVHAAGFSWHGMLDWLDSHWLLLVAVAALIAVLGAGGRRLRRH